MKNKKVLSKIITTFIIILLSLVSIGVVWVVVNKLVNNSYDFKITQEICQDDFRLIFNKEYMKEKNISWDVFQYILYLNIEEIRIDCPENLEDCFVYEKQDCKPIEIDELYLPCKEKCLNKSSWEEAEECLEYYGCVDGFSTTISKSFLKENPEWLDYYCFPYFNGFEYESEKYSCGNYTIEVKR